MIVDVLLKKQKKQKNGLDETGTDKGAVPNNTGESATESNFENAYVFPNPVRPSFNMKNDKIKIKGITENVNIKITDIEGNLVNDNTVVEIIYVNDLSIPHQYRWKILRTRWDKTESVLRHKKNYGNFSEIITIQEITKSRNNKKGKSYKYSGKYLGSYLGNMEMRDKVIKKENNQFQLIENQFIEILGTKVKIKPRKDGGFIEVSYFSNDDLERILELMNKSR